jgi:predicted permease
MLRLAWRRLLATPVFTLFAVVSLALGVGVTTAIQSAVVAVTAPGPDIPGIDGVAVLVGTDPHGGRDRTFRGLVSYADARDLKEALAADAQPVLAAGFVQSLSDAATADLVAGEAVESAYFALFDLAPDVGRLLQPLDDESGDRVMVLSHRWWLTRLGADPAVVGRTMRLGGQPFEVVGVAPAGFEGFGGVPQQVTSVWVPIAAAAQFPSNAAPPADPEDRHRSPATVLLRRPSAGVAQLSARVGALGKRLDELFPVELRAGAEGRAQPRQRGWSVEPLDAARALRSGRATALRAAVFAIVGLVLVVACTNLANLVLARGSSRDHERAVRRALGASRTRIVLEQLAETGTITVLAAAGAYVVMRALLVWFTEAQLPVAQALVVQLEPRLDASMLALSASVLVGALVVFGLVPAWQLSRGDLRAFLARTSGVVGQSDWRSRQGLVAVQVAISVTFVLIAVFMARLAVAERGRPPGIDLDRLALGVLNVHLPPWTEARAREAVDRLIALAPGVAGLDAVAVASGMPFGLPGTSAASFTVPGGAPASGRETVRAVLLAATPSIFDTLGVAVVRGRGFDTRDAAGTPAVVVVSELTARQLFGSREAVGRQIRMAASENVRVLDADDTFTVIGVAADTDAEARGSRRAGVVYRPLAQRADPMLYVVGRADDPADLAGPLKTLTRRVDPDLTVDRIGSASFVLAGAYALAGVVSRAASALAILAIALSMAGLFGVLSHVVSRRTREMGIRAALGADPRRLRLAVFGDGLRPVVTGLVLGMSLGALARWLLRTQLGAALTMEDLLVFVAAPLPIALAGWVACYWPARRASRVTPNIALRDL